MSHAKQILGHLILEEIFGSEVAKVGRHVGRWEKCALSDLLVFGKAHESLAVLINHGLATFEPGIRPTLVQYVLKPDEIIHILRYPRFLYLIKALHGDNAELLIEECLKKGQTTLPSLLDQASSRLEATAESDQDLRASLLKVFTTLVKGQFIGRAPVLSAHPDLAGAKVPIVDESTRFFIPESPQDSKELAWCIHSERFHVELRNKVLVSTVTRRIDATAGKLMTFFLGLCEKKMSPSSRHISLTEIYGEINDCIDLKLRQYKDHYLKVLEEDRTRFIDRVGDEGGGMFVINFKHIFTTLAAAVVENVIQEKFNSKALRIFRVVRDKQYVEETQIQKLVMIPARETKLLTYQLLENNFVQIQELRKSLVTNAVAKSFYLFHVDLNQVTRMVRDMCYQALANALTRKNHELETNARLLEKQDRIDSIASNIKGSDEFSSEEERAQQLEEVQDMLSPAERDLVKKIRRCTDKLVTSLAQLDETLLVLELFLQL